MEEEELVQRKADPMKILFTQEWIPITFRKPRDQERLDDAAVLMIKGKLAPRAFPPMRVIEFENRLWSLDNRRLWVMKKARVTSVDVAVMPYDIRLKHRTILTASPHLYSKLCHPEHFPRLRGVVKDHHKRHLYEGSNASEALQPFRRDVDVENASRFTFLRTTCRSSVEFEVNNDFPSNASMEFEVNDDLPSKTSAECEENDDLPSKTSVELEVNDDLPSKTPADFTDDITVDANLVASVHKVPTPVNKVPTTERPFRLSKTYCGVRRSSLRMSSNEVRDQPLYNSSSPTKRPRDSPPRERRAPSSSPPTERRTPSSSPPPTDRSDDPEKRRKRSRKSRDSKHGRSLPKNFRQGFHNMPTSRRRRRYRVSHQTDSLVPFSKSSCKGERPVDSMNASPMFEENHPAFFPAFQEEADARPARYGCVKELFCGKDLNEEPNPSSEIIPVVECLCAVPPVLDTSAAAATCAAGNQDALQSVAAQQVQDGRGNFLHQKDMTVPALAREPNLVDAGASEVEVLQVKKPVHTRSCENATKPANAKVSRTVLNHPSAVPGLLFPFEASVPGAHSRSSRRFGRRRRTEAPRSRPARKSNRAENNEIELSGSTSQNPLLIEAGDLVYICIDGVITSSCGMRFKITNKVQPRRLELLLGPYEVERKVNGFAAMLNLPRGFCLIPTLNYKFMRKSRCSLGSRRDAVRMYLIPEKVLNKRIVGRVRRKKIFSYLIKWDKLPAGEATWETQAFVDNHSHLRDEIDCPEIVNPFLLRNRLR